jgi:hypothetical protein
MIDWGDTPVGSVATLYIPRVDTNDILSLATQLYHSHRMVRIDEHTLKLETGGMSYVPIPATDALLPAMLTVDLPEGVTKGQVFKVVIRQVAGGKIPLRVTHEMAGPGPHAKHIVGSFQLTIPVADKAEILPAQECLLSNLRWIERAIPAGDRWSAVFGRYVLQTAQRVDALGGDSDKVWPSPSGEWQQAYRTCRMLAIAAFVLVLSLIAGVGALPGGVAAAVGAALLALLAATLNIWKKRCRPTPCQILRALTAGAGAGVILLGLLGLLGISTPQLIAVLIVAAGATVTGAVAGWLKGCFG